MKRKTVRERTEAYPQHWCAKCVSRGRKLCGCTFNPEPAGYRAAKREKK